MTKTDQEAVEQMVEYVEERGGLFNLDQNEITNICPGVHLDREASECHLGCITIGEEEYRKFKSERLEKKTVKLFDVISNVRKKKSNTHASSTVDLKKETVSFVRHRFCEALHVQHSGPASIRDHFNFLFSNQRWLPEKITKVTACTRN